jgi:hypothetical protein
MWLESHDQSQDMAVSKHAYVSHDRSQVFMSEHVLISSSLYKGSFFGVVLGLINQVKTGMVRLTSTKARERDVKTLEVKRVRD